MDKVLFKRKVTYKGTSPGITIPLELVEFLKIDIGNQIYLSGETGKHGRYLAVYKNKKTEE